MSSDGIPCPICTHQNHQSTKIIGYKEGVLYDCYLCNRCASAYVPPADAVNVYDSIYVNADVLPGYSRYSRYAELIKNKRHPFQYLVDSEECYFAIREALQNIAHRHTKILEVGCGLGYLTYALSAEGFDCTGCDVSAQAVKRAKDRFKSRYFQIDVEKSRPAEKYDVIILTEVIEHVAEPFAFIQHLKECLREDGAIVLTTPRKPQFGDDLIWDTELPPVHWTWITQAGLEELAKRLGAQLTMLDTRPFHNGRPRVKSKINTFPSSGFKRKPQLSLTGQPLTPINQTHSRYQKLHHILDNLNLKSTARNIYGFFQERVSDSEQTSTLAATLRWKNSHIQRV